MSARRQLDAIDWPFSFVEGLTAHHLETTRLYDAELNRKRSKRPLAPAEVAAYASHRKALSQLLVSDAAVALVLEDDFCLTEPAALQGRITTLLQSPVDWDILKLFDFSQRPAVESVAVGDMTIVSHGSPTAGMVGYLITRRGAERLLSRNMIYRQIDEDIKFFWELGLRVLSVHPNLVSEISNQLGGSLIERQRSELRFKRNWVVSLKGLGLTIARQLGYLRHRNRYRLKLKETNASA